MLACVSPEVSPLRILVAEDDPAVAKLYVAYAQSRDPVTLALLSPVYKGLSVLPDPDDVASWVVVLLTHPELTPSREDHPLRDHAVEDPEFEAQLARHAPGR